MKTFTINQRGEVPSFVSTMIGPYEGKPADNSTFQQLDADIEFLVVECRECHGNTDKGVNVGGAWLCPKNGDNSWNVRIDIK